LTNIRDSVKESIVLIDSTITMSGDAAAAGRLAQISQSLKETESREEAVGQKFRRVWTTIEMFNALQASSGASIIPFSESSGEVQIDNATLDEMRLIAEMYIELQRDAENETTETMLSSIANGLAQAESNVSAIVSDGLRTILNNISVQLITVLPDVTSLRNTYSQNLNEYRISQIEALSVGS